MSESQGGHILGSLSLMTPTKSNLIPLFCFSTSPPQPPFIKTLSNLGHSDPDLERFQVLF